MSRPFTEQERELLLHLIAGCADEDAFRLQMTVAEYGEPWFPGSQSFSITGPAHRGVAVRAPARIATVYDGGDRTFAGELLLWVADGYLADLEYAWVSDTMPIGLPNRDQVAVED